ncbi:MAG: hypothetical protein ABIW33_01630 [Sphingomicrobium sp.]
MSAYRLSLPYDQSTPRRRASGLLLALAVNLGLLLVLLTLGFIPLPGKKDSSALVVDLIPEGAKSKPAVKAKAQPLRKPQVQKPHPVPKPPPIVLPSKPTIAVQPVPWIEISSSELAAGDIAALPHAASGSAGDSQQVGQAPNGDAMYAAEWARRPTNAELDAYLPKNPRDGSGLIACKTIADNRVDDCVELANDPPGSHLASAVRQAAWQFRVRPPRKNGKALIGSWVRIRVDYENFGGN